MFQLDQTFKMQLLIKTLSVLSLLSLLLQAGCGRASVESAAEYQRIVERITELVGNQLDLDVRDVDVDAPLSKQKKAADDLDVVEIVMSVEAAFNIEIKDEEVSRNSSVKKLADIVSRRKNLK